MIAKRIKLMEDFGAFGGVCKSWRAAAIKDNFDKSWPQVPLLMLAEKKGSDDREFYSLCRKGSKIWRTVSLPEAKGKKCIESRGWFVTIDGVSGAMDLLHPFSRVRIQLPNQKTFPEYEYKEPEPAYLFIRRVVLSANPYETSNFVLMLVGNRFLGFWRPGDKSLIKIESYTGIEADFAFSDATYYNGKFYAISFRGDLWVWDVSMPNPTVARKLFGIDNKLISCRELYLVESGGELLLVARNGSHIQADSETYGATNFRIIQLDLFKNRWIEIFSLGERTIFVGHNDACSIDATNFPGIIKSNCIYFTDDSEEAYVSTKSQQGGGKDMGIYNLENRSIERFDDVQSFSLISPPVWITPSL